MEEGSKRRVREKGEVTMTEGNEREKEGAREGRKKGEGKRKGGKGGEKIE